MKRKLDPGGYFAKQRLSQLRGNLFVNHPDIGASTRIECFQFPSRAAQRKHVVDIKPYQARPKELECCPMTGVPKGPDDMGLIGTGLVGTCLVGTGRGRVKRQPISYHS